MKQDAKQMTKGGLEKMLNTAIVFVPKDKETKSVYFDDKGLRLTITSDFAVIATGCHRHVFNNVTPTGISRPYLYVKRMIDITLANDCMVKDVKGNPTRSYSKLFSILKAKEDKADYNIAWFVDLWLNNIFMPLYSIDETEQSAFLVYEQFVHNLAKQSVIFDVHKEDVTNHTFIKAVCDQIKKFTENLSEKVIFKKKTNEEKQEEEAQAMAEHLAEKSMEDADDGRNE